MKVKFWCDSGANIHSMNSEIIDIKEDFDVTDEEWAEMDDDEKWDMAKNWANDAGLEIGYSEEF